MRQMRALVVMAVAASAGCTDSAFAPMSWEASDCGGDAQTLSLEVNPRTLKRGALVTITVTWRVTDELPGPGKATLTVGADGQVSVEIPLGGSPAAEGLGRYDYVGSVLNPFGVGAPPGTVDILATGGMALGCQVTPTASTSMQLE